MREERDRLGDERALGHGRARHGRQRRQGGDRRGGEVEFVDAGELVELLLGHGVDVRELDAQRLELDVGVAGGEGAGGEERGEGEEEAADRERHGG